MNRIRKGYLDSKKYSTSGPFPVHFLSTSGPLPVYFQILSLGYP